MSATVQVLPESEVDSPLRVAFCADRSSSVSPVTCSSKAIVTVALSPTFRAESENVTVGRGRTVSTVMARVPACDVLPAASVAVAESISAPWPIRAMSATVRV